MTALLPQTTIGAAGTIISPTVDIGPSYPAVITAVGKFLYGAGGTTVTGYLQTSFDGGATWNDVCALQFATTAITRIHTVVRASTAGSVGTDGSLTAGTNNNGIVGRLWRLKAVSTGTYSGLTSLQVDIFGSR